MSDSLQRLNLLNAAVMAPFVKNECVSRIIKFKCIHLCGFQNKFLGETFVIKQTNSYHNGREYIY